MNNVRNYKEHSYPNFMYSIPVLLVFFNRKETALETFSKIKKQKPNKLYLACDGPRANHNENEYVEELRKSILQQIDWDCEVHTRFLKDNIGCSLGVSTAISWLFETEDVGIILEDDCVPHDSFFQFMYEMLTRYKDDNRVGMVSGANYIFTRYHIKSSYCFSKYKATHGWGTWKRSWNNMDLKMSWRGTMYESSILKNMGYCAKDLRYWKYRLKAIDHKHVSAWDWQWFMTLSAQNQLSIFPKVSLISNIGFGIGATHTSFKYNASRYISDKEITFPLSHPKYVIPDYEFDHAFYKGNNTLYNSINQLIPFKIKRMIKSILTK